MKSFCVRHWLQQAVTGSGKVEKKFLRLLKTQFRQQFEVKSTRGIKWIGLVRSKKFALPLGYKYGMLKPHDRLRQDRA